MWMDIFYIVIGLIVGAIVGFLGAKHYMQKQMKKNPPINEKMIRVMFMQMGRKPSEAQIKATMNAMNQYK